MATNGLEEQPTSSTPTSNEAESTATVTASPAKTKEDATKLAVNFLLQGKRHLVVRDFIAAIESLGESCRLLAELEPEHAKSAASENAEAHFFYGKALLEQSRIELGVFEGADLGKSEDASNDDSEDEECADEEDDDEEEESEEKEVTNGNGKSEDEVESSEATANGTAEVEKSEDSKPQESAVTSTDGSGKVEESEVDLNAPSPTVAAAAASSGLVVDNEVPSTSSGLTAEAAAEKQAEEELSNLELAWEVLEVAKIGFRSLLDDLEKKGAPEKTEELSEKVKSLKKRLADTHCSLGEVATESENYVQAIEEFRTGLDILSAIEGSDSREIAQYHFQMGLAYSFDKKFEDALDSFRKSVEIIENRISALNHKIETGQTAKELGIELEDGFKSEGEEVQELTALLPELQEKISDTIDAEKESQKEEEETKKEHEIMERNSPVKNPNPPVANDISHLVKKKKKAEEAHSDEPPVKKICTDVGSSEAMDTTTESKGKTTEAESAPASTTNGHPIAIDA